MKKKFLNVAIAIALSGSLLFSSCIGSFQLTNKLLSWNQSVGNKFVNEVVFLAFWIIPVYEISALADVLVLNSIEFWTGSNPVQAGVVKKVQGEKGEYLVETLENGYEITDENGVKVSLIYNKDSKIWSAVTDNEIRNIIKLEDEKNAVVFLPNGEELRIDLSEHGVYALRQAVQNNVIYLANN